MFYGYDAGGKGEILLCQSSRYYSNDQASVWLWIFDAVSTERGTYFMQITPVPTPMHVMCCTLLTQTRKIDWGFFLGWNPQREQPNVFYIFSIILDYIHAFLGEKYRYISWLLFLPTLSLPWLNSLEFPFCSCAGILTMIPTLTWVLALEGWTGGKSYPLRHWTWSPKIQFASQPDLVFLFPDETKSG